MYCAVHTHCMATSSAVSLNGDMKTTLKLLSPNHYYSRDAFVRGFLLTSCAQHSLVHVQVTIIFVVSLCLFVCLCRVFLSRPQSDLDQTRTHVTCLSLVVSPRIYRDCTRLGGLGDPPKTCIFRRFWAVVNHHSLAASFSHIFTTLLLLLNILIALVYVDNAIWCFSLNKVVI